MARGIPIGRNIEKMFSVYEQHTLAGLLGRMFGNPLPFQ